MTRPRLLLDVQALQGPDGERGIGRAVAELAAELDGREGALSALLLNPLLALPARFPPELLGSPRLRWSSVDAVRAAMRDGGAAYHVPSPYDTGSPGPVAIPEHALRGDLPLVVTVHDLIPLHEPERRLPGALRQRHDARSELVRAADAVLCDSEFTRLDAVERLGLDPRRTAVTGNGAAARFRPPRGREDPGGLLRSALPGLGHPYVLCVSGGDERKNTAGLLRAYALVPASVRRRHQLVVSCDLDPGIGRAWRAQARAAGLDDGEVVLTGFVPDEVLVALYQRAALVVMPSLDEGYGLPVAEAIACRRPVVTSNASALPEILGLPESTFDPLDEEAMARAIERGLGDGEFRSRLVAAGDRVSPEHRWPAVADRVLAAVGRLDAGPRPAPRARDRRLRVALIGPMPPVASGVADYNLRVATELARVVDLDVLTPEGAAAHGPRDDAPWRRLPAQALGRTLDPASYHALVYTIGNSWHHVPARRLALRFPGVVWFHDVRLAALHHHAAAEADPVDPAAWTRRRLDEDHAGRLGPPPAGEPLLDSEWVRRNGVLLTRELAGSARLAVVNTALGERLLRLDQGPDGRVPPILRLEHAVPEPPGLSRPERAWDPPVVATFGNVDRIKAP
ncbi:MAG TPA: glycosyltransferase family 1 protein, partial [Candidatus Dormibacteraeota bacterium]|nr:glycosyltransferase family 1 protein [Candidatus Dormibacteraeota bacterium]